MVTKRLCHKDSGLEHLSNSIDKPRMAACMIVMGAAPNTNYLRWGLAVTILSGFVEN
jgi:hypothetical protein